MLNTERKESVFPPLKVSSYVHFVTGKPFPQEPVIARFPELLIVKSLAKSSSVPPK